MLRLGLVEESARAWRAYLALDSMSPWAARARLYEAQVRHVSRSPASPALRAPPSAFAAFAVAEPQLARRLGWCEVLGAWAGAALRGDAPAASAYLLRADTIAGVVARRPGGDATLLDGVRSIRSIRGNPRLRSLARAHLRFSVACVRHDSVAFAAAGREFAAAAIEAGDSPLLRAWSELMLGSMQFHGGEGKSGERRIRAVAAKVDRDRHPALAGEAEQLIAVRMLRLQRHPDAVTHAARAYSLFLRAGERLNVGVALDVLSSAYFQLRDMDQGHAVALAALERMQPYRNSYRLHNLLSYTADMVADDGFPLTGIRMQDEGVRVAERTGYPPYVAEARLVRARLSAAAGIRRSLDSDLAVANRAMARISDSTVLGWMRAQMQMARATAASSPRLAAAVLDSAAEFFLADVSSPLMALPPVVAGARARIAVGDRTGAAVRLRDALTLLEQRRDYVRMEPRRAAVFEEARELVDRLTLLALASGDTMGALRVLDRGRASLAPAGRGPHAPALPVVEGTGREEVIVAYTLIADTLLAWTVAREGVSLHRAAVDRLALLRTIDRAVNPRGSSLRESALRADLARLYDWLIKPLGAAAREPGTSLAIVVDGELAAVPFSALYDVRRAHYLVEDHPVRFAVSVREARRPSRRAAPSPSTLLVADPAFRPTDHPELARLPGAAAEAAAVARMYPGARLLADTAARPHVLRGALSTATLIHYAGHAVFDDARPERSFLVLATGPGDRTPATLQAREIAQMDLRGVDLVVLSACETVRTGEGRAAGYSGLAGAFLAAGAGGAVGSLWRVGDDVAHPLMLEFHRVYRASGHGPEALRQAQLRMLRSENPLLRSPATWGSFRYSGT